MTPISLWLIKIHYYMLEFYGRLYRKTESWFTIKYSSQCLFVLVFTPVIYFGFPEYVGQSAEESSIINVTFLVFVSQPPNQTRNVLRGLVAACGVFIGYSLMRPYVGPFYKPHEGLWRAVAAIAVLYLLFLTFLFYQVSFPPT